MNTTNRGKSTRPGTNSNTSIQASRNTSQSRGAGIREKMEKQISQKFESRRCGGEAILTSEDSKTEMSATNITRVDISLIDDDFSLENDAISDIEHFDVPKGTRLVRGQKPISNRQTPKGGFNRTFVRDNSVATIKTNLRENSADTHPSCEEQEGSKKLAMNFAKTAEFGKGLNGKGSEMSRSESKAKMTPKVAPVIQVSSVGPTSPVERTSSKAVLLDFSNHFQKKAPKKILRQRKTEVKEGENGGAEASK